MSELKVNTISGIAGSVKVNDPVGIGAVAKSGYDLNVDGKVNLEGSVEVITVPASNFGVRIRAPLTATTSPGFGDATLQFTDYQGTERASIHAKSDNSLGIRTNNLDRVTISNTGEVNNLFASKFTGTATFDNTVRVNGQATFDVIPQCGVVPSIGSHLVNLAYLNANAGSKVYVAASNESYNDTVTQTLNVAAGTYLMVTFVGFDLPNDVGGTWDAFQKITISGSGVSTQTVSHEVHWTKTGGGGHGRTYAGAQMGISSPIVIPNAVTVNITGVKSATAYNTSTKTSWVALLIKS